MHTELSHTPVRRLTAELTNSATLLETQTTNISGQDAEERLAHCHTPHVALMLVRVSISILYIFKEATNSLVMSQSVLFL